MQCTVMYRKMGHAQTNKQRTVPCPRHCFKDHSSRKPVAFRFGTGSAVSKFLFTGVQAKVVRVFGTSKHLRVLPVRHTQRNASTLL